MLSSLDMMESLPNQSVSERLCSGDRKIIDETIDWFTGLSLEQRQTFKNKMGSFDPIIQDVIVAVLNEEEAVYILETLLQKWPTWKLECSFDSYSPLHVALMMGRLDLFDTLLHHGADPSPFATTKRGIH